MSGSGARLIAVDGISAAALKDAAKALAATHRRHQAGISPWGASGIFDELDIASPDAGTPSPRTLLLLYAADLAFRLRWQIRPALEEGRTVIAAPYVSTATAFGQAAGLDAVWLTDLFYFAPPAAEQHVIDPAPARYLADRKGFVDFCWLRLEKRVGGLTRLQMMDRTRRHLRAERRTKNEEQRTKN